MASTSKAAVAVPSKVEEENIPQLGILDEDDEFEEFETQDWTDADTALAHLSSKAVQIGGANGATSSSTGGPGSGVGLSMAGGSATAGGSAGPGTAPGASNGGPGDHLWKDNWDDDDVEDDFSKALRAELDKSSVAQAVSS